MKCIWPQRLVHLSTDSPFAIGLVVLSGAALPSCAAFSFATASRESSTADLVVEARYLQPTAISVVPIPWKKLTVAGNALP